MMLQSCNATLQSFMQLMDVENRVRWSTSWSHLVCFGDNFVDNQADCDNTVAAYAAALKEFLGLTHLARACRAGRRVRQFWPEQEIQSQHLKMIMNLGGFNDSNKVEV